MAGDWIKFETATSDKPEVWAIADDLGIDPDAVVGKLLRVWAWFDQHTTDGSAKVTLVALLDRLVGVTGFCKSLTNVGWLSNDGEVISIPNFDSHNGETAKKRCQTAKRVAKHKNKAANNAKVTQPPLAKALPREEKRREEVKDKTTGQPVGKNMPDDNSSVVALVPKQDNSKTDAFEITYDWLPTHDWVLALSDTGLRNGAKTDWQSQLTEFILYRMAKRAGEKLNQAGWEHAFLGTMIHNENTKEAALQ